MQETALPPNRRRQRLLAGVSDTTPTTAGIVEISGQRYLPPASLAAMLDVTERTLCRWDAARIGPPKIKVGKLILYNLDKLPEWLASQETQPLRARGRR